MDDGELIDQVQCFPALFDKADVRYKNKIAKENAWRSIAEILGATPEACEQRWIVLRAKYTNLKKKYKNTPTGSARAKEIWPYFEIMGFLDPFLTTRRTSSNYQVNTSSQVSATSEHVWDSMSQVLEDPAPLGTQDSIIMEEIDDSQDMSAIPGTSKDSNTPKNVEARNKTQGIKRGFGQDITNSKKLKPEPLLYEKMTSCFETFGKVMEKKQAEQSEDLDFARSLANDISLLTPRQKVYFKAEVYNLLHNILNQSE